MSTVSIRVRLSLGLLKLSYSVIRYEVTCNNIGDFSRHFWFIRVIVCFRHLCLWSIFSALIKQIIWWSDRWCPRTFWSNYTLEQKYFWIDVIGKSILCWIWWFIINSVFFITIDSIFIIGYDDCTKFDKN